MIRGRNFRLFDFGIVALWALSLLSVGCGGSSSHSNASQVVTSTGSNVAAISVNGGPTGNYGNGAFVSVTVCVPGSSNCQTIPDVLVDTGSTGLRILSSALTVSLTQQNGASGDPIAECLPFLGGYTWGPVQSADIKIAGESASAVPIQVIGGTFAVPSGCSNMGLQSMGTLQTLGANGLLGVGMFAQDCGGACAQAGSNPGLYYACPSSGCQVTAEAVSAQVQNPVAMFASDNNGVIVELPAVSGGATTVSGSLVFGIGTQSNNALNGASVYTVDDFGNFTTTYQGQAYSSSFLDSGSNGYFFLSSTATGLPDCTTATGFYCPTSTQNLSATNQGANGTSGKVNFSVGNAETLFANQSDFVFGDLGGPGQNNFDWGLPFFFGRNVFTAIEGTSTPGGVGPYWAY
ncbi:MAG TPA: DUF3443 domain-containing protein [Candidatus Sulfotelmatobacter sp.]|jgi:predicted aspartyl protease